MSGLIRNVVESQLCVSCGTCVGICPTQALEMHRDKKSSNYFPTLDTTKCIKCGACETVCPGNTVDFTELDKIFDDQNNSHLLMGSYIDCHMGNSVDEKIRFESTSGGIISSLLIHLLEKGTINGVIVIKMKQDNPLETTATIARNRQEIIESARSKYCPASPNVLLNEIKKTDGKYAVVGLPCHLHGIRKAEQFDKELREKIILHLGLMCSHTVTYDGSELVLEKLGIKKEEVTTLNYRGYGWPGGFKGNTENGKEFFIPLFGSWKAYWPIFSSFFYTPIRCIMCPDQTADYADISFGDAWLHEVSDDKIGKSVIVTRTPFAENIIQELNIDKIIETTKIDSEKIIKSQELNLKFKKSDLETRLKMLNKLGYSTPKYVGLKESRFSFLAILRGLYALINIKLSSYNIIRRVLKHTPFQFFRLYFGIYKILSSI